MAHLDVYQQYGVTHSPRYESESVYEKLRKQRLQKEEEEARRRLLLASDSTAYRWFRAVIDCLWSLFSWLKECLQDVLGDDEHVSAQMQGISKGIEVLENHQAHMQEIEKVISRNLSRRGEAEIHRQQWFHMSQFGSQDIHSSPGVRTSTKQLITQLQQVQAQADQLRDGAEEGTKSEVEPFLSAMLPLRQILAEQVDNIRGLESELATLEMEQDHLLVVETELDQCNLAVEKARQQVVDLVEEANVQALLAETYASNIQTAKEGRRIWQSADPRIQHMQTQRAEALMAAEKRGQQLQAARLRLSKFEAEAKELREELNDAGPRLAVVRELVADKGELLESKKASYLQSKFGACSPVTPQEIHAQCREKLCSLIHRYAESVDMSATDRAQNMQRALAKLDEVEDLPGHDSLEVLAKIQLALGKDLERCSQRKSAVEQNIRDELARRIRPFWRYARLLLPIEEAVQAESEGELNIGQYLRKKATTETLIHLCTSNLEQINRVIEDIDKTTGDEVDKFERGGRDCLRIMDLMEKQLVDLDENYESLAESLKARVCETNGCELSPTITVEKALNREKAGLAQFGNGASLARQIDRYKELCQVARSDYFMALHRYKQQVPALTDEECAKAMAVGKGASNKGREMLDAKSSPELRALGLGRDRAYELAIRPFRVSGRVEQQAQAWDALESSTRSLASSDSQSTLVAYQEAVDRLREEPPTEQSFLGHMKGSSERLSDDGIASPLKV